jgi:endonuclease/exonuclease/phosphatase family metal-dependent hydrolase
MNRLLIVLVLVSTSGWAATARIASWNMASNFNNITETRRAELVSGVQQLNADVIALAEVRPHDQGMAIATDLTAAGDCYNMTLPDNPNSSLDIGILSRCNVTVSNVRFIDGSNIGRRLRNALVADVTIDNFDFMLIALHLKASRQLDPRQQREAQTANISGYIEAHLELLPERDVLILGDYNMIPVDDQTNFDRLNGTENIRFITTDDLTGSFTHISGGNPGNLLDGFGFTIINTAEYQEGSAEVAQLRALMGKTLSEYSDDVSDHLPVVAEFETGIDHD